MTLDYNHNDGNDDVDNVYDNGIDDSSSNRPVTPMSTSAGDRFRDTRDFF